MTVIGRASVVERGRAASRSCDVDVERIQDHGRDTFVIDDGVQWHWTDADAERTDADVRRALLAS